jgi:hypothetical protein
MILRKWLICYTASGNPDNPISLVDLCRVDSLFSKRHFVLLVVVYWCHFLNDSEEYRYSIAWEARSSMSVIVLAMTTVEAHILGGILL